MRIKEMDSQMRQSGLKEQWFEGAGEGVYAVDIRAIARDDG